MPKTLNNNNKDGGELLVHGGRRLPLPWTNQRPSCHEEKELSKERYATAGASYGLQLSRGSGEVLDPDRRTQVEPQKERRSALIRHQGHVHVALEDWRAFLCTVRT
ncbi:hypothetical protein EYF80_061965 [Liparis tanakae]|uniref:Uncharacterized protein n=1 Tax=Liparis tanakae TaxID=230148 RepID=A0A4Z2EGJ4_9TELE|nr:hypothetical protein EYF80_061965 [Liparis tanakae]